MTQKFTISELSKAYSIPITTLRYYWRIGLFVPEFWEKSNNYYYYSAAQVATLEMITFLRSFNIPVKEIKAVLSAPICRDDILKKLAAHRQMLQDQIRDMEFCREKLVEIETVAEQSYSRWPDRARQEVAKQSFGSRRFIVIPTTQAESKEDGEWNLQIKQDLKEVNNSGEILNIYCMGTVLSLSHFRLTNRPHHHSVFLEPVSLSEKIKWKVLDIPPADYLVIRFANTHKQRKAAILALLGYIQAHKLRTEDTVYECLTDCIIPPVSGEDKDHEFHLRIL